MLSRILDFQNLRVVAFGVMITALISGCSSGGSGGEAPPDPDPLVSTATENYFIQTPSASKTVSRIQIEALPTDQRLAALSLQGIVNRDVAEIYTHCGPNLDEWIVQFYKDNGYITSETVYTDAYTLLGEYASEVKGVVVYDPLKQYTINLAVNIAGVEDCVVVSPSMLDRAKGLIPNAKIIDIRDMNFEDEVLAWDWYFENVFPKQNHSALAIGKGGLLMFEAYYDYVVQCKYPLFWLPGPSDSDYSVGVESRVRKLFTITPDNIPVLGFWPGVEDGKDIGWAEADGVRLAGSYGKFTIVNTWAGNYSFHSGVKPSSNTYSQSKPRNKTKHTYDPTKKYVALIMIESGDAPCYFTYNAFNVRQWNDPQRGTVPISYGITPALRLLAPALLRHYYDTQSENDYFFMSISGAGYCYPLDGFANKAQSTQGCIKDYFEVITQRNMKTLDFDMIGIHSVKGRPWDNNDYALATKSIAPMQGLKSIIAGMNRVGDLTASNSHKMLDGGVSVHHTITFWAIPGFQWDDQAQDDAAVNHLENEIKTYGADGKFIQAMFLSWDYGPRRLKKLQTKLEAQGYVFVTLNEFDNLWRESKK